MQIVETDFDLNLLMSHITSDIMVIDAVCMDAEKHSLNNEVSILFFYFLASKSYWCAPIKHNEGLMLSHCLSKIKEALKISIRDKFVINKKNIVQLLGEDYDFVDVNLIKYLSEGKIDDVDYSTNAHKFVENNFRNIPDVNMCVPLLKHARAFMEKIKGIDELDTSIIKEDGFKFVNNTTTNCFAQLEANGMCVNEDFTEEFGNEQTKHVKNNLVYTQYNLLTSTGRPSNRFASVNYAALNKTDNSRTCFVSRHSDDGMLVMMDYNAFHPRLIAHLVNFHMEKNENPYAYLSKYYFNKKDANEEDIAVAKAYTFPQIYGGFDKKWLHIPYFAKIQEYIDHRWKFYTKNGYIETPKYKRKIKTCHIPDANPSKLFNYILQAFETEMAVGVLGDLLEYLKHKKSKPVLYTYDSILFDMHKDDKMDTIKRLKSIMERDKFPVKVYIGKNYKDMKHIDLA